MAGDASVLKQRKYVANPIFGWWNPGVAAFLRENQIGLITGQRSVDDVLRGMDAAWKEALRSVTVEEPEGRHARRPSGLLL
jgi:hypothetical protein